MKREAVIFLLLYSASLGIGYTVSSQNERSAEPILTPLFAQEPFVTLGSLLRQGNLAGAVALTFAFNLTVGAFLTTTLPNVIPVVGATFTIIIAAFRGILIGAAYSTLPSASVEPVALIIGTLILEFGGYILSSAVELSMTLRFLRPKRYSYSGRKEAFIDSWRLTGRVYLLVVIALFCGALWEMTGIFLLSGFPR